MSLTWRRSKIGRFQVLGKYGRAGFHDSTVVADPSYGQRTAEVDLNYIIKTFDARLSVFFKRSALDGPLPDQKQVGVGLQLQI